MTASNTPDMSRPFTRRSTLTKAILYATVVIGILDATDGVVFFGFQGKNPIQVLQYIGSGVLGSQSFADGLASAALGLLLHFAVSFVVAAIYILASRQIPVLRIHWVFCGLLYGAAVWAVMNLAILPLTAIGDKPIPTAAWFNGIIGHALFVGLPSASFARRT